MIFTIPKYKYSAGCFSHLFLYLFSIPTLYVRYSEELWENSEKRKTLHIEKQKALFVPPRSKIFSEITLPIFFYLLIIRAQRTFLNDILPRTHLRRTTAHCTWELRRELKLQYLHAQLPNSDCSAVMCFSMQYPATEPCARHANNGAVSGMRICFCKS